MNLLSDPSVWTERLGYLPVPLSGPEDRRRYVLLNGTKGNFCLDITAEETDDARQVAWSADTDNFVSVSDSHIRVSRWDHQSVTTFPTRRVLENLERFQAVLETSKAPRERSVVSHFMRAYRSLRNAAMQVDPQIDTLVAFLALLDRAETEYGGLGAASLQWEGAARGKQLLDAIPRNSVDFILNDLVSSRTVDGLTPIISVVLRHASGRLFQEAHYLVESNPQLPVFAPDPVTVRGKGSATGAYFTPTPLVRAVVEQTFRTAPPLGDAVTIFDPACGSGEFLREAVRHLTARRYSGTVSLIGWDVSLAACAMARFALAHECRDLRGSVVIRIELANSVLKTWPRELQYVMTNPPFQAWEDMSAEQRQLVSSDLGELRKGRPDLASVFVARAISVLSPDGALGCVLPASFFDSASARNLRSHIAQSMTPAFLARLGSQLIFRDVLVDTGLFIGIRNGSKKLNAPLILWADHQPDSADVAIRALRRTTIKRGSELAPLYSEHYSVYLADTWPPDDESWAPRSYHAYRLLRDLRGMTRVENLFAVQQGSRTGLNAAFLLDRDEVSRLPKKERQFFRPAVVNESIHDGHLNDNVWVFFPYGHDSVEIGNESALEEKVPTYYRTRLRDHRAQLKKRAGNMSSRWWELTRPRTWQFERSPKIVSKYFGRRGAFALDKTGDFVVVQGFAWMPAAESIGTDLRLAYAYVATLNSALVEILISGVSNNVAGGQWNLSAKFVSNLPLPVLTHSPEELVDALAQIGQQMSEGQPVNRDALDALVEKTYLTYPQ